MLPRQRGSVPLIDAKRCGGSGHRLSYARLLAPLAVRWAVRSDLVGYRQQPFGGLDDALHEIEEAE
jgi:hypothetical protein